MHIPNRRQTPNHIPSCQRPASGRSDAAGTHGAAARGELSAAPRASALLALQRLQADDRTRSQQQRSVRWSQRLWPLGRSARGESAGPRPATAASPLSPRVVARLQVRRGLAESAAATLPRDSAACPAAPVSRPSTPPFGVQAQSSRGSWQPQGARAPTLAESVSTMLAAAARPEEGPASVAQASFLFDHELPRLDAAAIRRLCQHLPKAARDELAATLPQ